MTNGWFLRVLSTAFAQSIDAIDKQGISTLKKD